MKTTFTLALVCAALAGCAIVPDHDDDDSRRGYHGYNYDRHGYHRDHAAARYRDYGDRRYWRDDDRDDTYYRGSIYLGTGPYARGAYFGWDHGQ
jgi:hypothetical protein